ncbi:hypothetical protein Pint_34959 [Pistacia integerrima]|uniref:Uncharacterized protein n=1 Tax=Pistacia integerrima TaxID=434235 RepID=A0ACC0Y320_9ROSI|nr:hypothetical protein Pint_34959 [Pistacia integerrima]
MNSVRSYASVALLNGEIYVFGGGDRRTWYNTDVDMSDLKLERWIGMLSLQQKRFSFAAAEIDGVLYPTGGFDGKDYLNSAENFDYRMCYWEQIASMNSKRTCHSLVVLSGKLYALGAYDGSTMVSSIEIYDSSYGLMDEGGPNEADKGIFCCCCSVTVYICCCRSGNRLNVLKRVGAEK